MSVRHLSGDCRAILPTLPAESVHCVVTSPPYFGLRDYGVAGQIGLEPTPDAYVAELVGVFREVRRVVRRDGTLWLNLGDSYAGSMKGSFKSDDAWQKFSDAAYENGNTLGQRARTAYSRSSMAPPGLKPKDLIGIPWAVAFALRADGWYLRSDIIWSKPNPMPESVTDRPTRAHEYLFLLSRSQRYYFDQEAVREAACDASLARIAQPNFANQQGGPKDYRNGVNPNRSMRQTLENFAENPGRNIRSVWTVATQPFSDAHFATFPPDLIEPCIKAGVPERCCAKCSAPWVRETERTTVRELADAAQTWSERPSAESYGVAARTTQRRDKTSGLSASNSHNPSTPQAPKVVTLGFSPSCACEAGTVPGTVLDPFGGAGTTGLVADRLQRNAILIELSNAYASMATNRINTDRGGLLDLMEAP